MFRVYTVQELEEWEKWELLQACYRKVLYLRESCLSVTVV